ncbi:hypothetical protein [Caballeronia udeis]|uniref:hypothetical protein n=1 Tax=Caballeronia udeis TaxID=1232866 RepID=UPI0012E86483|nr:hypothetical protein [Caballeronia udeis]
MKVGLELAISGIGDPSEDVGELLLQGQTALRQRGLPDKNGSIDDSAPHSLLGVARLANCTTVKYSDFHSVHRHRAAADAKFDIRK